jgi:hypothetical protein
MKRSLAGVTGIKCVAVPLALMVAAPLSAQTGDCLERDCFYDRQVRDFRVIDSETVVIYVGANRCPYLVKVSGFYCDLKYIPDIDFYHERERRFEERSIRARGDPLEQAFGRFGSTTDGFTRNDRICSNNAPQYALDTFGFGAYSEDQIPVDQAECPVHSVVRITDDDLIELYTQDGMAPPPPIGNGSISRSGDTDTADEQAR